MIIRQAQLFGVTFGKVQLVDAVHTVANVNVEKDPKRQGQGKPLADPDAEVVDKGEREVTKSDLTTRRGEVRLCTPGTRLQPPPTSRRHQAAVVLAEGREGIATGSSGYVAQPSAQPNGPGAREPSSRKRRRATAIHGSICHG